MFLNWIAGVLLFLLSQNQTPVRIIYRANLFEFLLHSMNVQYSKTVIPNYSYGCNKPTKRNGGVTLPFYIIGFYILATAFVNYKRGLIYFLGFKLFLVTNITLISIPGVPLLTLDMFMTLVFILLFLLSGSKNQHAYAPFPYKRIFLCLAVMWAISAVLSIAGPMAELSGLIGVYSQNILLIWIIWEVLDTKEDFEMVFKLLSASFFVICLYGLLEFVLENNFYLAYAATLNHDSSKVISWIYTLTDRGFRLRSVFEHPIGAGINFAIYAVFVFQMLIAGKIQSGRTFTFIIAVLCILGVILTKMRASIVFFGIFLFSIVQFKKRKFYILFLLLLIACVAMFPIIVEYIDIFLSIFNAEAQKTVGGSNIAMRFEQMRVALNLAKMSPIFGLGKAYQEALPADMVSGMLGSESIWLQVIPEHGLMGTLLYILWGVVEVYWVPKRFRSKEMFFLALAFWVTRTATSTPGMHIYLYYMTMFYYIKTSKVYATYRQQGMVPVFYIDNKLCIHIGRMYKGS